MRADWSNPRCCHLTSWPFVSSSSSSLLLLLSLPIGNVKKAPVTARRQNLVWFSLQSFPWLIYDVWNLFLKYLYIIRNIFIIFACLANLVQSSLLPIGNIQEAKGTANRHNLVQFSPLSFQTGNQVNDSNEDWTVFCRRAVTGTSSKILCVSSFLVYYLYHTCVIFIIFTCPVISS